MKWLLQLGCGVVAGALLIGVLLAAPSPAQSSPQLPASGESRFSILYSVRAVPERDGPVVEIISSRPVVPTISKLDNPARLVIDLPNSRLGWAKKRIDIRSAEIEDIRLNQFQENPPVARIVVDLAKPVAYSWDASNNLLLVRLRTAEAAAKPASVPAIAPGVRPVAGNVSSAAPAGDAFNGSHLAAGSSVTAGSDAAVVRLGRGGEVRVCPGTTISVTPSRDNRSLMLGMGTGGLEAHYALDASADSIITPDFRILLAGPGEFHYAIRADSRGNTCIQALAGNTASVIVSELLGDGTYQVKPTEHVVLQSGQVKNVALAESGSCGCPAPASPLLLTSSKPPAPAAKSPAANPQATANSGSEPEASSQVPPLAGSETAALPPLSAKDVHVQVDAPFVFRGNDPTSAPPAPILALEILPLRSAGPAEPIETAVLAPAPAKLEHHGFFGKLRGFFAAIFS